MSGNVAVADRIVAQGIDAQAFDYPYREIEQMLDKSVPATRQLAHRARTYLTRRPRFVASQHDQQRLTELFLAATRRGDMPALTTLLAENVTGWADGGAKMRAARRPIQGHDAVARWLVGVHRILYVDARESFLKIDRTTIESALALSQGANKGEKTSHVSVLPARPEH
jgi:RNA polymerase sigma-70 factor (ECF subfamily)